MPQPPLEALHVHVESGGAPRRRTLTILFSDLCESTRLAGRLEAEDYFDLIARLRACYHQSVERHGGIVAQISGDGMLAVFGWPEAREGDGRRAVEAALDLHGCVESMGGAAPLRLHSGIHSGLVILQEGDACRGRFELPGHATNIASRLCAEAGPGEILVSEATLGPDRHGFTAGPPRRLRLRGTDAAVVTLAVSGRAAGARAEPAPLIGRDAERSALAAACGDAAGGTPRFVLIEGPPGVGKTRLAEEVLRSAAGAGWQVHRGECEAAGEPLHPFREIVRSLRGGAAPGDEERGAAASAELVLRAAAGRPTFLFIDDWHAADDASREALALLRRAQGVPLMVLATARRDCEDAALQAEFETLVLSPFSREETGRAVERLLPSADPFTVEEVAAASGGNALFIEELCHAMAAGGSRERPEGGTPWLANLIESRLSRLQPDAAALVRIAAVIGNVVPSWLLEAISGRGETDPLVRSLAEYDFVHPAGRAGTLRFKHGITREVIYSAVGLHERRALHRRIAEALKTRAPDAGEREPVEALAYHYLAANEPGAAAYYSALAGERALAASALDRAQAHYKSALDALDRLREQKEGDVSYAAVVQRLGLASVFAPARDQLPYFERAVALAASRVDNGAHARALYWLGYIHYALGESRAASRHLGRALQLALGLGDDPLVVQIRSTLGQAKAAACEYRGALRLLDEAIEVKRRHRTGARPAIGLAYSLACKAFVLADLGRFAEARAGFDASMEAVDGAHHEVEGSVLCLRSAACLWEGDVDEALRNAGEAERVAERVRTLYLYAMSRSLGAYARSLSSGEIEGPLETILQSTRWLEDSGRGQFISLNYGWLADLFVRSGRFDEARRAAVSAIERARRHDRLGEAMAWRAAAKAAAAGVGRRSVAHCLARSRAAARRRDSAHELAATARLEAELLECAAGADAGPRARRNGAGHLIETISGDGSSAMRPLSSSPASMPIIVPIANR
jgi:class 3 adenylate cyclase/tetratricopeptide (TPR) repeat protein